MCGTRQVLHMPTLAPRNRGAPSLILYESDGGVHEIHGTSVCCVGTLLCVHVRCSFGQT